MSVTRTRATFGHVGSSTGLITGGVLSIGVPNTTFSISDGSGVVIDITPAGKIQEKFVTWSGKTNLAVTNIGSQLITFISIDVNGNVIQQASRWTANEIRSRICLGVVVHTNNINVEAVDNQQHTATNVSSMLADYIQGIGFVNVDGNVFSPNGNNLQINKSAGIIMGVGVNYDNDPDNPLKKTLGTLTSLTFQYRFQNGTNGSTGIYVNPNIYDVAGVSTAVPTNKFTVQRIYSFVANDVKIQPGQTYYNSLAEAISAIQTQSFITENSIRDNGLLRGFLIVREGATNLSDPTQAKFLEAGKFGGSQGIGGMSTTNLQNAYDNSLEPEIVTDTTRGALTVKRGSASDSDDVFNVKSGSDEVVAGMKGTGEIYSKQVGGSAKILLSGSTRSLDYTDGVLTSKLQFTTPTANRVITIRDLDGTVAYLSDLSNYIPTSEKGVASGVATLGLDGKIPLSQIPASAIETVYVYAGVETLPQNAGLTTSQVQTGDVVKMNSTGVMYVVKDDTQLNAVAGYEEFNAGVAASVPWSGVTGKPTTLSGYGISSSDTLFDSRYLLLSGNSALTPISGNVYYSNNVQMLGGPWSYFNLFDTSIGKMNFGTGGSGTGGYASYWISNPGNLDIVQTGPSSASTSTIGFAGSTTYWRTKNLNSYGFYTNNHENTSIGYSYEFRDATGNLKSKAAFSDSQAIITAYSPGSNNQVSLDFTATGNSYVGRYKTGTNESRLIYYTESLIGSDSYFAIELSANKQNGGTKSILFGDTSSTFLVTDSIHSTGLIYAADYSANFTARSLVDKGYVSSFASANYLALSGGAMTGDITFSQDGRYVGRGNYQLRWPSATEMILTADAGAYGLASVYLSGTYVSLSGGTSIGSPRVEVDGNGVNMTNGAYGLGLSTALAGPYMRFTGGYYATFVASLANDIVLTLPTSTGTLALTSQLSNYLLKSGGDTMTGSFSMAYSNFTTVFGSNLISITDNTSNSGLVMSAVDKTFFYVDYATAFSTKLSFTAPTANRTITFKDGTGTVAFTSDIPASIVTGTGTANRMTYWTATGTVAAASSIYASTTIMHINSTSAPANNAKLGVTNSSTITTGTAHSVRNLGTYTPGSASTANYVTTYNEAIYNSANALNTTGYVMAGYNFLSFTAAGAISANFVNAQRNEISRTGTTTITTASVTSSVFTNNNASGGVTNLVLYHALLTNTAGSVTNAYAYYLNAGALTGATNKWGLYLADGNNYLSGSLSIGTTSLPAASDILLRINGAMTLGTTTAIPSTAPNTLRVNGVDLEFSDGTSWKSLTSLDPKVSSTASTATLNIDSSLVDLAVVTALTTGMTIAAPTGSPTQGRKLLLRIYAAGVQTLTWNAIFRAIGLTLPAATVAGKTMYIGAMYNSTDTKWDVISYKIEA